MFDLPRRVKKEFRIGPCRVRAPAGDGNRKKTPSQIIYNNPRSSIKPGSVSDP